MLKKSSEGFAVVVIVTAVSNKIKKVKSYNGVVSMLPYLSLNMA